MEREYDRTGFCKCARKFAHASRGAPDYSELQNAEKPIPQALENQDVMHSENFACNNAQKENSIKKWAVQNSNL